MVTNCIAIFQKRCSKFSHSWAGELPLNSHPVASKTAVSRSVNTRFAIILTPLNFVSRSHLDYNILTEVNSGSLYGLSSLQQLFLSNNSIGRINPDGWKFCQKLREL